MFSTALFDDNLLKIELILFVDFVNSGNQHFYTQNYFKRECIFSTQKKVK